MWKVLRQDTSHLKIFLGRRFITILEVDDDGSVYLSPKNIFMRADKTNQSSPQPNVKSLRLITVLIFKSSTCISQKLVEKVPDRKINSDFTFVFLIVLLDRNTTFIQMKLHENTRCWSLRVEGAKITVFVAQFRLDLVQIIYIQSTYSSRSGHPTSSSPERRLRLQFLTYSGFMWSQTIIGRNLVACPGQWNEKRTNRTRMRK